MLDVLPMLMPMRDPSPVTVYSATDAVAISVGLLRRMLQDTWRSRHLIREMMIRDLTSQYRQSVLGILVSFFPVLATTAWATLFQSANLINAGGIKIPYPFFVLCGMLIWTSFLESLEAPVYGVVAELPLLAKSSIPPEVVTFGRLGQVMVNFVFKTLIVALAAIFYRIPVPWTALLAPLGALTLAALGSGIGMVLAPINLIYRDVSKALPVLSTFWFFLTPVLYMTPTAGAAAVLMRQLNPVSPILVATRALIFPGTGAPSADLAPVVILSGAVFLAGWIFHRITMPVVMDRANS